MINWWRNWRARKRLEKQARADAPPIIDNIKEGQRGGVFVSAGGTIMLYKWRYKIQRIRPNGDLVLKKLKEVL